MDVKKYLDYTGLTTLCQALYGILATKSAVQGVNDAVDTLKSDTDMYVTEIDYSQIQFSTTESYKDVLISNDIGGSDNDYA